MSGSCVQVKQIRADARISIRRPPSNALNESLLRELSTTFQSLATDPSVHSIVFCGAPNVFMAGADLPFFARSIIANDLDRILRFTRSAQALLTEVERCEKRVVAWVQGAAIGAGVELALACHEIWATGTAKFSFPETGLGIYPGMGGTQRLPRRVGRGLGKWMILAGPIVSAEQALEIGLLDGICPSDADPLESGNEIRASCSVRKSLSPRLGMMERLFGENSVNTLLDPSFAEPGDPLSIRTLIQLRGKAPIALRLAERIIERGLELPLEKGLDLEFAHLSDLFATEDARTGLLTLGKTRPQFAGR